MLQYCEYSYIIYFYEIDVINNNVYHLQVQSVRNGSRKKVPKVDKKLQAAAESLAARGFVLF